MKLVILHKRNCSNIKTMNLTFLKVIKRFETKLILYFCNHISPASKCENASKSKVVDLTDYCLVNTCQNFVLLIFLCGFYYQTCSDHADHFHMHASFKIRWQPRKETAVHFPNSPGKHDHELSSCEAHAIHMSSL